MGHAIKRPKLNKSVEKKPTKISELPVPVRVDLPSSSSVYSSSPSVRTPTTSGQLSRYYTILYSRSLQCNGRILGKK